MCTYIHTRRLIKISMLNIEDEFRFHIVNHAITYYCMNTCIYRVIQEKLYTFCCTYYRINDFLSDMFL